jgi:hypothetical protein
MTKAVLDSLEMLKEQRRRMDVTPEGAAPDGKDILFAVKLRKEAAKRDREIAQADICRRPRQRR